MPRIGRLKYSGNDAWYHLYSRVAAFRGEYPLSEAVPLRRLLQTIEHYSAIYFCEAAAYCVMGTHYHLVCKFDVLRPVSREELRARTRLMYPSRASQLQIELWSDEQWEHYRQRLFDVSEYMRNIQSTFARWYNHTYQRRGRFWADRFKSVYLEDKRAVLDCMLYIDLNPIRGGMDQRPEEWQGSSIALREIGKDDWLLPLTDFVDQPTEKKALIEYRERLGYFVDGLALGTEAFIRDQLARMREEGRYLRRKNPIPQLGGIHLSLREQRSTAVIF